MKLLHALGLAAAAASVGLAAACSSWDSMSHSQQGTTVGAASGAVGGAVVAGPVGAVVGGAGGAIAGHELAKSDSTSSSQTPAYDKRASIVRSAQQTLNDKGYDAGPADGRWGPKTEDALRKFQAASGMQVTGQLDSATMSALGIHQQAAD